MSVTSRFLDEQSGAVSVEAIVLLPCLLLSYFAITGVHAIYDAKQRALATARSCAWLYSAQGCDGLEPTECAFTSVASDTPTPNDFEDLSLSRSTGSTGSAQSRVGAAVATEIGDPQRTVLGQYTDARARITGPTPSFLGWGEARIAAHYHLACNLKPQKLGDVVRFLWEAVK